MTSKSEQRVAMIGPADENDITPPLPTRKHPPPSLEAGALRVGHLHDSQNRTSVFSTVRVTERPSPAGRGFAYAIPRIGIAQPTTTRVYLKRLLCENRRRRGGPRRHQGYKHDNEGDQVTTLLQGELRTQVCGRKRHKQHVQK